MATSALLVEATTRNQAFLERLKSGEVGKFAPFLQEIDRGLRDRLTRADITGYERDRINKLLSEVDGMLLAIYGRYSEQLRADLVDIAQYQAGFEARALEEAVTSYAAVVPGVQQVRSAVLTSPLSVRGPQGGLLLKGFIDDWTRAERQRVTGAIRRGYFEGRTTQQILQEVRGTRARGYKDGLLAVSNRHAATVVRTGIQHAANTARLETWRENEQIVTGYRWVSTLDSRTSEICRSLDGRVFKLDKGPVPPAHPNCRSTTVAELDGRLSAMREGATRASEGGQVDANETYYSWLKRQPASVQDAIIGPNRGRLLRDGGLSAERFAELQLDKTFRPMTLDDMRRLEPTAFKRAGI